MAAGAVPVIFVASIVIDGPILQGAGQTIDAIGAATVPLWLAAVAINLGVLAATERPGLTTR